MSTALVFERSVCFCYSTRVFSVVRDAGTKSKTATRKQKEIQEVIHPSRLSATGSLKQEAFRLCRSYGTKMDLIDLWIVPTTDHDALSKALLDINHRWDTFVHDELLPNYLNWVDDYASKNPNEAVDILRLAPTLDEVKQSTRFAFASFSLSNANLQAVNVDEEVSGLWGQVLKEIAAEIKDAHMHASQSFTQAARAVLSRITRKCNGLGFLHPRLGEISAAVENLLSAMPSTGAIKGNDALAIRAVLDRLLNPAEFMRTGFGISEQQNLVLDCDPDTEPDFIDVISIGGPAPDHDTSLDAILGAAVIPADDDLSDYTMNSQPSVVQSLKRDETEPALAIPTDFNGW